MFTEILNFRFVEPEVKLIGAKMEIHERKKIHGGWEEKKIIF
jgi:hypothetical protein